MSDSTAASVADDKVELSIQLDRELLEQVSHLTTDPSKVIEVALRQWLKGSRPREDELTRALPRNPTIPPKGEWND
ncbi:MAG TPA: hypothetical protein V6D07_07480 [Trichocoleus sp.]